ncbi:MAG: NAD(P)/FAD-dependent oxidoreductase [Clostridiaceae bacterium]
MDYDVIILGGGIVGCAVAYELSKYNLNIALIEKDFDIADDISFINTSIVYDGAEAKDDRMAKLEQEGNKLFDDICDKFNIPFRRVPSLTIAADEEDLKFIEEIKNRADKIGIKGVDIIDEKSIKDMHFEFPKKIKKALYNKNTALVSPYDLAISYGEVAYDNGVNFKMEEAVIDVQRMSKGLRVITNKSKFTCRMVVNTISTEGYGINNNKNVQSDNLIKKLTYISVDPKGIENQSNIIFTPSNNNNFCYNIPSLTGERIFALVDDKPYGFHSILKSASGFLKDLNKNDVISFYHSEISLKGIFIDDKEIDKGYINVAGASYGKITITPALAIRIAESVSSFLNSSKNNNFIDKRRDFYRFKVMNNKERNDIIALDKKYGKMVCLCNQVTEGEIVDSIRRPLGARTLEGVKRRTGAGMGSCHGAYCTNKIISILAREMGKSPMEIVDDSKNSYLLNSRIKEFDDI